jgi:uncharacterized protein with ATP-grasp and redox domains
MKAKLDCIPCIFNQAFRASRNATTDKRLIREVLNKVGDKVKEIDLNLTPPEAAMPIYGVVEEVTGNSNPYSKAKKEHIEKALSLYPKMKEVVDSSSDPLKEAIKIAIAGNAIDLGSTLEEINIQEEFVKIESANFIFDDLNFFRKKLEFADEILYLSDNAGETVFDRPLIEILLSKGKKVIYTVKEKAIINDATREDAVASGIKADILSTGSGIAGTVLKDCSESFLNMFYHSSFIIAKGQGNYETLSNVNAPIFFLFKVKCEPISMDTGFPRNSMLLIKSKFL